MSLALLLLITMCLYICTANSIYCLARNYKQMVTQELYGEIKSVIGKLFFFGD